MSAQTDEVPLAVIGIVPCKVTAEAGPIVAGDLLVTSSTPGHAMKATDMLHQAEAALARACAAAPDHGLGPVEVAQAEL